MTIANKATGTRECKMYITPDRRIKPRIVCDYPAIIEGYEEDGSKYNEQAKLANLSASGLYMLAKRHIEYGTKLSVIVLLSNSLEDEEAPRLVTSGTFVRTETTQNGRCGIAMKFINYRFL